MGKHDKSDDYETARIEELEARLKFAEEAADDLRKQVAKYNRWMSEIEAAAAEKIAEKDDRIAKLEATIIRLAVG